MSGIRPIIDSAVVDVLAEHPKYFTPRGHEHARTVIVRKVMAAIRGDGAEKPAEVAATSVRPQPLPVEPSSREGRAYSNLCRLSGAVQPWKTGAGHFILPAESANEAVYALAELPDQTSWQFLTDRRQIGAWTEFFAESLPNAARRPIIHKRDDLSGILMPWPWPPGATGKIYSPDGDGDYPHEAGAPLRSEMENPHEPQ